MKVQEKLKVGMFIEIPAWQTSGVVVRLCTPSYGSKDVQCVDVQEHSDSTDSRKYTLEPDEYIII